MTNRSRRSLPFVRFVPKKPHGAAAEAVAAPTPIVEWIDALDMFPSEQSSLSVACVKQGTNPSRFPQREERGQLRYLHLECRRTPTGQSPPGPNLLATGSFAALLLPAYGRVTALDRRATRRTFLRGSAPRARNNNVPLALRAIPRETKFLLRLLPPFFARPAEGRGPDPPSQQPSPEVRQQDASRSHGHIGRFPPLHKSTPHRLVGSGSRTEVVSRGCGGIRFMVGRPTAKPVLGRVFHRLAGLLLSQTTRGRI